MEEKLNGGNTNLDENREIALGICFGSGIGVLVGAVLGNVGFGLSGGGVIGILVGIGIKAYKKIRLNSRTQG